MPVELYVLASVLVLIAAVGVPLITKAVWLPRELSFEKFDDIELSPRLLAYFQALDVELSPLGFGPVLTFEVTNLQGANMTRVYQSEHDSAVAGATCMRGEAAVAGAAPTGQNYVEWITRYEDGSSLTTRNVTIAELFDLMPGETRLERPGERNLEKLKAHHDRKAEELRVRGARFPHGRDVLGEFAEYHERWTAFQESQGLVRYDPEKQVYKASAKAAWRGVANYLNPLADNFSLGRFALGLLLGSGLPVLGVLAGDRPEVSGWAEAMGATPEVGAWVVLGLAFTLGGAAVGALFTTKSFVWALLLGYVPIRLLGGGLGLELVLVLWMGVVAEQVSAVVEKRRLLV